MIFTYSFQFYLNKFFGTNYSYQVFPIMETEQVQRQMTERLERSETENDKIVIFKRFPRKRCLYMKLFRTDNWVTRAFDEKYPNWKSVFIFFYNCLYYHFGIDFDIFDVGDVQTQIGLKPWGCFHLLELIDDFKIPEFESLQSSETEKNHETEMSFKVGTGRLERSETEWIRRHETGRLERSEIENVSEEHSKDFTKEYQSTEKIIWSMWWQDEIPEIVKYIIDHRVIPEGFRQIIVTKRNIHEYITIPEKILNLVEQKQIRITFLSDYIRFKLISKFGGIWMDSTLFTTNPSLKILSKSFSEDFQMSSEDLKNISDDLKTIGVWHPVTHFLTNIFPYSFCTYFFMFVKNHPIARKMVELFEIYYDLFDIWIFYFTTDELYGLILRRYPKFRQFQKILNINYSNMNGIYKLTYKSNLTINDIKKIELKDNQK